jgi:phage-related protein
MELRAVLQRVVEIGNSENNIDEKLRQILEVSEASLAQRAQESYQRLLLSEMPDDDIVATIARLDFELKQRIKFRQSRP